MYGHEGLKRGNKYAVSPIRRKVIRKQAICLAGI